MKLITTLKEIQACIPVLNTASIGPISPFIGSAERNYIINVIGKAQFDQLVTAYTTAGFKVEAIVDPVIREAVIIAQRIVSNLGYYTGMPILNVNIGASGITVFSNEDTKQAFQWQVDQVKEALIELGFTAIEELLLLMEHSPDIFHEYINSAQFRRNERFLIQEAGVFSDCFNINGSRYVFQMLSSLMQRVEDQIVKRLYGAVFFEALKADHAEGARLQLVTDYLNPGIALLTGAKAIVERIITFRNGVASVNLAGNYGSEQANVAATRQQVIEAVEQLTTDGSQFLQDGITFLLENVSVFPDFIRQAPKRRYTINNDKDKGVFVP